MLRAIPARSLALMTLTAAALLATGCVVEEAEQFDPSPAPLTIYEATPDDDGGGLFQHEVPLALGSRVELEVMSGGSFSVTSSNPQVVAVLAREDFEVTLKALSVGTSTLTLASEGGQALSFDLEVADVARTEIKLLPWNELAPLPQTLLAEGAAILPESPVRIFARHYDAQDRPLQGHSARAWSLEASPEARLTPQEDSDFATLRSGQTLEELQVTHGDEVLALEVIDGEQPMALSLFSTLDPFIWQDSDEARAAQIVAEGQTLHLHSQDTTAAHLIARLGDGRYVIGAGATPLTIATDAPEIAAVLLAPGAEGEDADIDRAMANARLFLLAALAEGTTTIEVTWGELRLSVPVEVAPR